jgi:hypothetical protein
VVIRALSGSIRYIKGVHQRRDFAFGPVNIDEAVKIATH